MAVAELPMTSVNALVRNMTRMVRVVGGRRVRRVPQSVLIVPAMREQTMRVGPRETGIVHANRVEAPLPGKPIAIVSHAEADNRIPKAKDLCLHGDRVPNVLLVHRRPRAPVRKKRQASVVTNPHVQGNIQLHIAHVRWHVQADIPVLNGIPASV